MRIGFMGDKLKAIEARIDGLEGKQLVEGSSVSNPLVRSMVSDLGKGVIVPTKDVIRGLQRLHEAKPSIWELAVKLINIATFGLCVVILVVK